LITFLFARQTIQLASYVVVIDEIVDNNNIALLMYGLPSKEKSDQPEDGSLPEPKHVVERRSY